MPHSKVKWFLAILAVALIQTGCQKSNPAQLAIPNLPDVIPDPNSKPYQAPASDGSPQEVNPTPNPDPFQDQLGERCISNDPHRLCLGLKIYAYEDADAVPVLERIEAESLVREINEIWSPCDIAFQLEKYEAVSPAQAGFHFGNEAQWEINKIRKLWEDDSTFLVVVTGPWSGNTVAWTTLPGIGPFGAVLAKDAGRSAQSVAHELGHYQGLKNSSKRYNLMSSRLEPLDRRLTQKQCEQARTINFRHWTKMLRN